MTKYDEERNPAAQLKTPQLKTYYQGNDNFTCWWQFEIQHSLSSNTGMLTLNSSSTSPHQRQNSAQMRKIKVEMTNTYSHRVPVSTTQEQFRGGTALSPEFFLPTQEPLKPPSPTLCSLLPLISTPGHPQLPASFPYPINPVRLFPHLL